MLLFAMLLIEPLLSFSSANNNNFDGPETVSVSGYYALEIDGPCTWVLVP